MQHWEYAAGHQSLDDSWVPSSEPGTYEKARTDLEIMTRRHEDESWMISPSILRRSERQPEWQPVHDHAAEVLAEVLEDLRHDFTLFGAGIIQGTDITQIMRRRAQAIRNTLPNQNQEYDS